MCAYLSGYDPVNLNYIRQGFSVGFRLNYEGELRSHTCSNLPSVTQHHDIVAVKIKTEIQAGRIAGPFVTPPFDNFHISPIGLVPKRTPGEFRLIHNLSYPEGQSVNDGIPTEFKQVHYDTIDDAIYRIKNQKGPVFLAKTDIKSAFRIIPIHPDDYPLLGFTFDNKFYYDKVLPMGCASSCRIFSAFSTAIKWIAVNKLGVQAMVHILDDFLLIVEGKNNCAQQLNRFLCFCDKAGIPWVIAKTFGPDQILPFIGITLDTLQLEARLPPDKLLKCATLISNFKTRSKVTLKELQSLIGLLNFACLVVLPGRPFLRRLIDLTIGFSKPYHHISLNLAAKADLTVWESFLVDFNGVSFFHSESWVSNKQLKLYTDAAGSLGFAAIFGSHWIFGAWPSSWKALHITVLEFYPIVAALFVWGHLWKHSSILFLTDNEALVHVINKQTSKNPHVMFLVRMLVLKSLKLNVRFRAKHVRGKLNTLPDLISRFQVEKARRLAPWLDVSPTSIPQEVTPEQLQIL